MLLSRGLVPDVTPYIILSAILLSSSCSNMFWSLAWLALVEVTGLCGSSCSLLDVTTFFGRDFTVVACSRDFAAVLGCATGEFVGDGLIDAGFDCYGFVSMEERRAKTVDWIVLDGTGRTAVTSSVDGLSSKATVLGAVLGLVGIQVLLGLSGNVHKILTLVLFRHGAGVGIGMDFCERWVWDLVWFSRNGRVLQRFLGRERIAVSRRYCWPHICRSHQCNETVSYYIMM